MRKLIYILLLACITYACQDATSSLENKINNESVAPLEFTSNSELQAKGLPQQKEAIIDLQIILENILRNNDVSKEIYYLGRTEFYADYYIALEDLLYPESSELYAKADLPKELIGHFKNEFEIEIAQHPEMVNLTTYVQSLKASRSAMRSTTQEDDIDLYIYCPYCLDVPEEQTEEPIIVPTTVDAADEAVGNKLLANGDIIGVLTNDDIAEENLTYIVTTQARMDVEPYDELTDSDGCCEGGEYPSDGGSGGSSGGGYTPNVTAGGIVWPTLGENFDNICANEDIIKRVYVGKVRVTNQYDPYIGFINSGGSEMRILRIDGYLKTLENGQIATDPAETLLSRKHSRRDIRKERWVSWTQMWEENWECDNKEQAFVIYEDDNDVEINLSGSIETKFKLPFADSTTTVSASFSTKIPSDDDLIRQWRMDGKTFFKTNLYDQGCGFITHENFGNRRFPIYDCGAGVAYTLPHNYFE